MVENVRGIIWEMEHSNLTLIGMHVSKLKKLLNEGLLHANMVMRVVYPGFCCRRLAGQHIEE